VVYERESVARDRVVGTQRRRLPKRNVFQMAKQKRVGLYIKVLW